MEAATYTVLSNGVHTDSTTGVRYKVKSGEVITMQRAVNLGLAGAAAVPNGKTETQPRTATPDGRGAGAIIAPCGRSLYVPVTSSDPLRGITLPDVDPGSEITLYEPTNGYLLRTHDPATVGLNAEPGATTATAIADDKLVTCRRASATSWRCVYLDAQGNLSTVAPGEPTLFPELVINGQFVDSIVDSQYAWVKGAGASDVSHDPAVTRTADGSGSMAFGVGTFGINTINYVDGEASRIWPLLGASTMINVRAYAKSAIADPDAKARLIIDLLDSDSVQIDEITGPTVAISHTAWSDLSVLEIDTTGAAYWELTIDIVDRGEDAGLWFDDISVRVIA